MPNKYKHPISFSLSNPGSFHSSGRGQKRKKWYCIMISSMKEIEEGGRELHDCFTSGAQERSF